MHTRKSSSNASSALERLRAAREARNSGQRPSETLTLPEIGDVYEEVSEAQYRSMVSDRREDEEFVIDDGCGYLDDGEEMWHEVGEEERRIAAQFIGEDKEINEERMAGRKQIPKKVPKKLITRAPTAFLGSLTEGKTKVVRLPEEYSSRPDCDDINVDSLLDDLLQKPTNDFEEPGRGMEIDVDDGFQQEGNADGLKEIAIFGQSVHVENAQRKIETDANVQSVHEATAANILNPERTKRLKSEHPVKVESAENEANFTTKPVVSSFENTGNAPVFTNDSRSAAPMKAEVSTSDGKLRMYWIDAYEDSIGMPGTVFLIGKVRNASKDVSYSSCCVRVQGLQRNLFLLPREFHRSDPTKPVKILDVYTEFNAIAKQRGINEFRSKSVSRKYVFEKRKEGVPRETTYLKVVYSAKFPTVPMELVGDTFSAVFTSTSSPLELFILKRALRGPSWLEISNAVLTQSKLSWCRNEFVVNGHKNVSVMKGAPDPPPMVVFSMSMKTVMHPKTKNHEVVMVCGLVNENVNIDGVTTKKDEFVHFTAVRKLNGQNWPFDLRPMIQKEQWINLCDSERELLSYFLAMVFKYDPDVITGHNIAGFDLEVLLNRINDCKLGQMWSKLGRLKKKQYVFRRTTLMSSIPISRNKQLSSYALFNACSGRLVCDLTTSARELIRETNYSLAHLSASHLSKAEQVPLTEVLAPQVPKFFNSSKDLLTLIRYCQNDSLLSIRLMFKLMVIPLTKQLTCLCGNLWSNSLRASRSDRIEYLLLHEFHRQKFILPERLNAAQKKERQEHSHKKASYAGGLVLEPKRGFYDQFILLLDFNSLYPSIIQEYDICFTTLPHWEMEADDERNIKVDSSPEITGLLPHVIAHLVTRRRAVKQLLKKAEGTRAAQLDIRQKALKLVANSMYGCLGFSHSRFYCKPLAAMVTGLGRFILQATVELTESLGYEIIYGDTDSIMVNTCTKEISQVHEIGQIVVNEVNKRYKRLEIDIDGVYQSMLLLRKKKYAALAVTCVNGVQSVKKELKGLDLVRRDWCQLSKDMGLYVVNEILSGKSRDDIVESIHSFLISTAEEIRSGKVLLEKFAITKALTKAPHEYSDAKSLPHVNVALEMVKQGRPVRVGDFIEYIITEGEGSPSARAHHPSFVTKNALKVDIEWYLTQQILPPISRLCEPINGMDVPAVANSLGLDASRFHSNQPVAESEDYSALDIYKYDDSEAYKKCDKLRLVCRYCNVESVFQGGLFENGAGEYGFGLKCPTTGCAGFVRDESDLLRIQNFIRVEVFRFVRKFMERVAACDERMCDLSGETRLNAGSHGDCPRNECSGRLREVYTPAMLYTQLRYYRSLFDVERSAKKFKLSNVEKFVRECGCESILKMVEQYMEKFSYHWVEPADYFKVYFKV